MTDKSAVTTEATVSDANTSNVTHTMSSMSHRVSHMSDMGDLGMMSFARVGDLHHGASISSISVIGHVLDPAVRERHAVLALDVAGLVPAPALAEVSVVIVIMDPVGEVEGVGLVTLLVVTSMSSMTSVTSMTMTNDTIRERNTGGEASEDSETGDCEGLGARDERMRTQSLSMLTIMLVVSAHKCK